MLQIFLGFIPWILYWALSASGHPTPGILAGFAAAAGLVLWRWFRSRSVKTMEIVTLGFFGANTLLAAVLGLSFFRTYDIVLVNATLALMAWGSLLAGSPFTYEYARESYPRELWHDPLFRRTNEIITMVWGAIFLFNTALSALSLAMPETRVWFAAILPNLALAAGIAFSSLFPGRYTRHIIRRQLAARDPWPSPSFTEPRPEAEHEHDVIVVGSGIGGLSAAALLAQRGLKVAVFEQHYLPGGFCTAWPRSVNRGGQRLRYIFDSGVHDVSGLGEHGPVTHLLRQLGIADCLAWQRMDHEYILPDGFDLKVPRDVAEFVAVLAERFPGEGEHIAAFFAEMQSIYREMHADNDSTGGVPGVPRTVEAMLAFPAGHPHMFRWMHVPFGQMLDQYFREPGLKALLSALTGYLTDDPAALTAGAMAPIFGYYFDGGYYPLGSSQALADALVEVVRQYGGQVYLRTAVKRIVVEDGRAVGIEIAGDSDQVPSSSIHRAGAVISNADLRRTYFDLVGREHLPVGLAERIAAARPSTSAFMVFLGLDMVPDIAPIAMVGGADESVGIVVPSKVDPSLAPEGHASVTLISLVPQSEAGSWDREAPGQAPGEAPGYTRRKREAGDRLIGIAEHAIPGLRDHVIFRQEASPATFARYAWTTGGAIYGPASGQNPGPKSPVPGLYLAGASAFPGAGIEAVVISGTAAADAVCPAPGPERPCILSLPQPGFAVPAPFETA